MMVKKWFAMGLAAGLICLGSGRIAPAQETTDPDLDLVRARVDNFLEGVSVGGRTQAAYQELLAGSWLLKQTKQLEALVTQTDQLAERYGPYRDFEPIAARRVGKDLILLRYLYKCEQFPVVFYFAFYRTPRSDTPGETSNNSWRVIVVRFDTELELLALTPDVK